MFSPITNPSVNLIQKIIFKQKNTPNSSSHVKALKCAQSSEHPNFTIGSQVIILQYKIRIYFTNCINDIKKLTLVPFQIKMSWIMLKPESKF